MNEVKYEIKNLYPLIGGKIVGPIHDDGGWATEEFGSPADESFGFRVVKGKKKFNVWVSMDPEGNGPGHLEIEPTA